jgi:hypothetical protein
MCKSIDTALYDCPQHTNIRELYHDREPSTVLGATVGEIIGDGSLTLRRPSLRLPGSVLGEED